jgi:hypothetical protein
MYAPDRKYREGEREGGREGEGEKPRNKWLHNQLIPVHAALLNAFDTS